MAAPTDASRSGTEILESLASYAPALPTTDRDQLRAFARGVLGSMDARDIREALPDRLPLQLEHLLTTLRVRRPGEIKVQLRRDPETESLVLETVVEDQPFLVSTIRAALRKESLEIRHLLNTIVRLSRDASGEVTAIDAGQPESIMRIEFSSTREPTSGLADRIRDALRLAQAMVRDFGRMKETVQGLANAYAAAADGSATQGGPELRETEALLRWICDENFVFLAVEEYDATGRGTGTAGISTITSPSRSPDDLFGSGHRPRYLRSVEESPVHRAGKPGHFVFPRLGANGRQEGACVISGLFTYKALHTPQEEIPVLRDILRDILTEQDVAAHSHRGKSITNAFNSLPLEFLFGETREGIRELTYRILRAEAEGDSEVHFQVGDKRRFAFVVVSLPRAQFSEELRLQVQQVLVGELQATYADYGVYMDRYDNAVVHYYITGASPLREVDEEQLRVKVLALAKGWQERLEEAIASLARPDDAASLFETYENAFTDEHRRRASVARIASDIQCLEAIRLGASFDCDLYVSQFSDHPGSLNLRTFSRTPLNLSQTLPVVGNFGFEIIDEYSRPVRLPHLADIDLDNYRIQVRPDRIGLIMGRREQILEGLRAVFGRTCGDDSLNRLVTSTSLRASDVELLRAYVAYLHQAQVPFDSSLIRETLVEHGAVSEALVAWLAARFDPKTASAEAAARTEAVLASELKAVTDYTADRVLSAVAETVRATRRTNAYVVAPERGEALAFKLAPRELSFGRDPKPLREIWVYHADFQGVHLRGGRIARGGIRFSDRKEDFRTEIWGLATTQMVKNVLIVPMGAKGGFVLTSPPKEPDRLRAAGDAIYRRFVQALLSLTDNVVDGRVVTPNGILRAGEDDPYLVVAADKGTAHLSDAANEISMARGFWLDDAFASGGSNGYDHKITGITARGAWEACKRSFRELGIDPEVDVITATGVGDMSGDVFGNGLLRTRTVKLLAAFDHRHIFIDPSPDPATSFNERKRLFELPGSKWTDYDPSLLSKGGGVYSRTSKVVDLSPEARALLGVDDRPLSGAEVMRAILALKVDLLWMGGIGTYVKGHRESQADVGDKANDAVRVDARDLRCRVLAEGANLAITDAGRVEFARRGGQNYSAFLDNSGGVDLSDHEVNIKILLAPLLRDGSLSRERRNVLLREAEPEVVEMVLHNNRSQSRMVSYDMRTSAKDLHRYSRTLEYLAERVPFSPAAVALPNDEELSRRTHAGVGIYKCEAALLCAYSKMLAYRDLLADEPLDDATISATTHTYFPAPILEVARHAVDRHLLRREIATTQIVNQLVDSFGASFFPEMLSATGRSLRDITHATLSALRAGDVVSLQQQLYALEDKHRQETVYELMRSVQGAVEEAALFILDGRDDALLGPATLAEARDLLRRAPELASASSRENAQERIAALVASGVPEDVATRASDLNYLTPVLDALRLSATLQLDPYEALRRRQEVAERMNLARLRQGIQSMVHQSPWDGPAAAALGRRFNQAVHDIARLVGDDVRGALSTMGLDRVAKEAGDHLRGKLTISGLVLLHERLTRTLRVSTLSST